jgi:hypothetical protein
MLVQRVASFSRSYLSLGYGLLYEIHVVGVPPSVHTI